MALPAANEAARLAALHDIETIGSPSDHHFEVACRLAQVLFSVPIAAVTFVAEDRVLFKSRRGIDGEDVARDAAFCSLTILSDAPLVIDDAAADPVHAGNPLVAGEPHIRFYAGAPLVLRDGIRIGTLCVMDRMPRALTPLQVSQLQDLAGMVMAQVRLHDVAGAKRRTDLALRDSEARYVSLAESLPQMVWVVSGETFATTYRNACFRAYYGEEHGARDQRVSRNHPEDLPRMEAAWTKAVAGGHTFEVEGRLRRHDGTYRWHKLVMIPVTHAGRVSEWLGTALDVHDIIMARDKLEETSNLLRLAQEAAGACIWEWDLDRDLVRHSPESARLFGMKVATGLTGLEMASAACLSNVHADDRAGVEAATREAIASGATTYTTEFRTQPTDADAPRCLTSFGRIVRDEATGRARRVVGFNLDVTESRATQDALVESEARMRVSEERLALALDGGSNGLWDWDVRTDRIWFSDQWYTMFGYRVQEMEGCSALIRSLIHPDDLADADQRMMGHIEGRTPLFECEHRFKTKSGVYVWVLARGKVVTRDADGAPLRVVGTQIDITARKMAEQQISHMARHDTLTDLPNRILFHEKLDQRLADVQAGGGRVALLFLDLDRFKTINDTLGHLAGDALLRSVAGRLVESAGESCTVARLGGDEFAVIVPHLAQPRHASLLAQRIIDAVGRPIDIEGRSVTVGASIGITLAPDDGTVSGVLLKNADIALYRSKAAGRNTHHFYEPGMDAVIADRNRLEFDLREAVVAGALSLHYQPVIDIADGAVCGFEALMRWSHDTRGMVSPTDFIPLAEETGLIVPLGIWALREACQQAAAWPDHLRIAVNVSTLQFQQPGLEESVVAALTSSGLAPQRLELEVTESVLMHDADMVVACLNRLRAIGVRIALDDFGTGYSSLSYLRKFPFDKIKIDRSFIRDIADPDAAAIVRAVVGLGARRGTAITAEGVETPEQLSCVVQEGCTEVQGYLFSRPLTATDALAFSLGRPRMKAA